MGASCRSKEGEKGGGKRERQTNKEVRVSTITSTKDKIFPLSFSPKKKKKVRVKDRLTFEKFISEDEGMQREGKRVDGFLALPKKKRRAGHRRQRFEG